MNTTVIYYTSNQEDPKFEGRIMRSLKNTIKPLLVPLVSVSQKPIKFGTNICVGSVGVSSHNAWRQLQIGAKAAKTKFICTAEADCLYPAEYFMFTPTREDTAYIADPLYILFSQRGKGRVFCYKSRGSESAMIVGRQCLIDGLEKVLSGFGTWGMNDANGETIPYLLNIIKRRRVIFNTPIITFKTDNNMHRKTPHNSSSRTRELPQIGKASDLVRKYLG